MEAHGLTHQAHDSPLPLHVLNPRFAATKPDPPQTSRVGAIEDEGIDLGSAKNDLNNMLIVTAVNTAFASSEQRFKIIDKHPLFRSNFDFAATAFIVIVIVVDELNDVKRKEEERKNKVKGRRLKR